MKFPIKLIAAGAAVCLVGLVLIIKGQSSDDAAHPLQGTPELGRASAEDAEPCEPAGNAFRSLPNATAQWQLGLRFGAPAKEKVAELMKQLEIQFQDGKFEEAEHTARRALELEPENLAAEFALYLARAMQTSKEPEEVTNEEASEPKPETSTAPLPGQSESSDETSGMSWGCKNTNRPTGAEQQRAQVASLIQQFSSLFKEGKYAEAEVTALMVLELDPDNAAGAAALYMVRTQQALASGRYSVDCTGALREVQPERDSVRGVPSDGEPTGAEAGSAVETNQQKNTEDHPGVNLGRPDVLPVVEESFAGEEAELTVLRQPLIVPALECADSGAGGPTTTSCRVTATSSPAAEEPAPESIFAQLDDFVEPLPFTGTHPGTLDEEGALALPIRVREQLGQPRVLFACLGPEAAVWLLTTDGLHGLAEHVRALGSELEPTRAARIFWAQQIEPVAVSPEGHMVIPASLARRAGLSHEIVVIGVDDHFELWDAARWQQYLQRR